MSHVTYTHKNYTHNLSTNSRAYELLQESKKDPSKSQALVKHLEQVSKEAKEASKNTLTPVQWLASMGFKVVPTIVEAPNAYSLEYHTYTTRRISRMDNEPITKLDLARWEAVTQLFQAKYPDRDIWAVESE